jgi:hypothetical protein
MGGNVEQFSVGLNRRLALRSLIVEPKFPVAGNFTGNFAKIRFFGTF